MTTKTAAKAPVKRKAPAQAEGRAFAIALTYRERKAAAPFMALAVPGIEVNEMFLEFWGEKTTHLKVYIILAQLRRPGTNVIRGMMTYRAMNEIAKFLKMPAEKVAGSIAFLAECGAIEQFKPYRFRMSDLDIRPYRPKIARQRAAEQEAARAARAAAATEEMAAVSKIAARTGGADIIAMPMAANAAAPVVAAE